MATPVFLNPDSPYLSKHFLADQDAELRQCRRTDVPVPGYQATMGTRPDRAARDALSDHPLARHIDDFKPSPKAMRKLTSLLAPGTGRR